MLSYNELAYWSIIFTCSYIYRYNIFKWCNYNMINCRDRLKLLTIKNNITNIESLIINEKEYDPFAICCYIRKKVERFAYDKIIDPIFKHEFLDTHRASEKLKYAEEKGIEIPETYFLLGIIYNDGMHYKNNDDAISGKLENLTIKKMINEIN